MTEPGNGRPAALDLPAPGFNGSLGGNKDLAIDAVPATVTGLNSTKPNGSYPFGTSIPITVTFDKPVTVTGTPKLNLNSGGAASYTSGSGTTTLTFTYTVGAGQATANLDYASANPISLNGGTINDQASGAAAGLTLPAPGSAGSLGANKNIVIDSAPPTVVDFRVLFGSK